MYICVYEGSTSVQAYFPQGRWYDFFTNATVSESGGETMELSTPMDQIQVETLNCLCTYTYFIFIQ